MDFERSDLPSGITVVTERMPSVRSVTLGFWIRVGSRDETPAQAGASHFLEHLLFKGTERRDVREIAEALDAVGGTMNAFTSKEYTCFYARVLDRDVPLAVDVVGDMIKAATNRESDVDAERRVVLEEINIHIDSPDDLVHSDFAVQLLPDHGLGLETLGSIDSITGMNHDILHGYYLNNYRPENLTVAAAGNLDHEAVVRLVDEMLGDLGRPGGAPPKRSAPQTFSVGDVHVRNRPTEQVHVVLGGRGIDHNDPRRFSLKALNTILGGGMSSRLFQEVRERRGLAYSTYSYLASYSDGGYFGAYAGTAPSRAHETLSVMRDEMDSLVETVTDDEVERAKGTLKGSLVLALEDTSSRMTRLGRMVSTDQEVVSIDEALQRIDDITLDTVKDVGADVLGRNRLLSVVGPCEDSEEFQKYVSS